MYKVEKVEVTIYTDGACSGNPGPGGWASVIFCGNNKKEIYGAKENTTNNQMELMAAIEALKALTKPCKVKLYSDSAYLVNAYNNNWVKSWKKNGWKNSSKEPVKNIDLWQEIERLREIHDVTFIKVKGHADNEFNNRCDELAVNAIKELKKNNIDNIEENNIQRIFKNLPIIETERLKLRVFEKKDACDLYEYCKDDEVTKYLPFNTYTSIDDAYIRIEELEKNYRELKKPITWAIEYKENGKVIGSIDFVKWHEKDKVGEIGYVLNKDYWNMGIMTEAVSAVIKFGFEKMELNRIEILCDERNVASYRVMEKNNLKYEGTFRERVCVKGEFVNIKCYSMLKNEYEG